MMEADKYSNILTLLLIKSNKQPEHKGLESNMLCCINSDIMFWFIFEARLHAHRLSIESISILLPWGLWDLSRTDIHIPWMEENNHCPEMFPGFHSDNISGSYCFNSMYCGSLKKIILALVNVSKSIWSILSYVGTSFFDSHVPL